MIYDFDILTGFVIGLATSTIVLINIFLDKMYIDDILRDWTNFSFVLVYVLCWSDGHYCIYLLKSFEKKEISNKIQLNTLLVRCVPYF